MNWFLAKIDNLAGTLIAAASGLAAAQTLLSQVQGLSEDDLVLCLISGGGSSLLPLPLDGLTLQHKQDVNRALLTSGATISEMNCVRLHLSAIKGGRLAAACYPARVLTLLISDVPGDDPIDIASGPTVPDPTTSADALAIAKRLAAGRQALLDAVEFIVQASASNPNAAYAGSVPYLMLAGNVIAGWQMARSFLAGQALLGQGDDAFMQAKMTTARFYADHILSKAPGVRDGIVDGADSVTAMALEAF